MNRDLFRSKRKSLGLSDRHFAMLIAILEEEDEQIETHRVPRAFETTEFNCAILVPPTTVAR